MSDGTGVEDVLRVLVVGDDAPADAAMDALSSRLESVSIVRERTLAAALERLTRLETHCVVCGFDPGEPERLERLRDGDGKRPIVAVLPDGATDAEAVDRALGAGATDVVTADDPGSLIATRVQTAAERGRFESAPSDGTVRERLETTLDALVDGVAILEGATVRFANAELRELANVQPLAGADLEAVFEPDLAAAIRARVDSAVARWTDPLSGTLAESGTAVDVFVTPMAGDRTLCVVRERSRSATAALSTVRQALGRIRDASARPSVRRAAVDAALEATPADLAGWYLVDGDVYRAATVRTAAGNDTADLLPIDRADLELPERSGTDGTAVVFDRDALEPVLVRSGIRAERVVVVPAGEYGFVLATSTDPLAFGERDRLPLETVVDAATTALEGLDQSSALRTCRSEHDRLAAAVERDRRLREIERVLLGSDVREEIHRHLCEAVVDLEFDAAAGSIELAWFGDVTAGTDRIAPVEWAGRDGDTLEPVTVPTDAADESVHPTARAATTLEPVVVTDLEATAAADSGLAWPRRALECGFHSVLSVPLVAGEFCYGVLTLYADARGAFDDAARRLPVHLATVAGHAVAGAERKRALLADSVTELEVVLAADTEPLSTIAHHLDRRLDVQAAVPRSSGGSTVFCTVSDLDTSASADLEALPAVESARLVGDRENGGLVELVLETATVADTLAAHGGVLRSMTPVDDAVRLVVDLPSTVDVRSFVRMVDRQHAGARLTARRERDRTVQSAREFDADLRDRLSERQLRTLETAYYGGFFDWPRGSTGEELADALGVSQPTFSRHLRLAQGKVFASLFEDRAISDR